MTSNKNDNFLNGLFERLSDPFISRYISFFITWNWKSFVYLWNEKNSNDKIDGFQSEFGKCFDFSNLTAKFINFTIPLLILLFFIYLYPKISKLIIKRIAENNKSQKEITSNVLSEKEKEIKQLENNATILAIEIDDHKSQIKEFLDEYCKLLLLIFNARNDPNQYYLIEFRTHLPFSLLKKFSSELKNLSKEDYTGAYPEIWNK